MIERFINQLQISLNLDKEGLVFPDKKTDASVKNEESVFKIGNFIVISENHAYSIRSSISPIFSYNLDDQKEVAKYKRIRRRSSADTKKITFKKVNYEISNGFNIIIENIESLNVEGYLIVVCDENDLIDQRNNLLKDYLSNKGFSINAIIGLPQSPSRFKRRSSLYIISKSHKSTFIADMLEDGSNSEWIINNFINNQPSVKKPNKQGDIELGYFIEQNNFISLYEERSKSRIEKITAFDKGYKTCALWEILVSVSSDRISADFLKIGNLDNSLFIKNIDSITDNFNDIHTEEKWVESIATLGPLKGDYDNHKYFYISIDKKKVKAEYLVIFLRSYLGRELYKLTPKSKQSMANAYGKALATRMTKEDLNQLQIYYPDLKTQEDIIEADSKLNKLQDSMDEFKRGLSTNPNKLIGESSDQIFDLLDTVGKLNDAERIRTHMRKVEFGYSEFKETWFTPVDSKGKIMKGEGFQQKSNEIMFKLFRVINSFLNSYGGDLMIGIDDNAHDIRGIEKEIKHWFPKFYDENENFAGIGKYNEKFKLILRSAFNDEFIGEDKNIFWKFVPMNGKTVFLIRCRQSSKRCYIKKGKVLDYLGHSFYQRIGDSSEPVDDAENRDIFWSNRRNKPNQV